MGARLASMRAGRHLDTSANEPGGRKEKVVLNAPFPGLVSMRKAILGKHQNMTILVVDTVAEQETYKQAFRVHNYEDNNLIFCNTYQQAKEFLTDQLETKKRHIDVILVANTAYADSGDVIKAKELLETKDMLVGSYSGGNFRICAIPMIMVTPELPNRALISGMAFDDVVEKNRNGYYGALINAVESQVRRWRQDVIYDLGELGLDPKRLKGFVSKEAFTKQYQPRIGKRAESVFAQHTNIVSLEFIKYPDELPYDWITTTVAAIEKQVKRFGKGFRKHKPYNRYDNENTILHPLLKENPAVLLRDNFVDYHHEQGFPQSARFSKRPDFILQPPIPDLMTTEWFEVKKENVKLLKGKSKKEQFPTDALTKYALQVWRYKKYAEDKNNERVIANRLGYIPGKYSYALLIGRAEETDRYKEQLTELMTDHYHGINLVSYEDLERSSQHYLERFDRLKV